MRHALRKNKSPSQCFPEKRLDIRQRCPIFEAGEPLCPYDSVNLFLCLPLLNRVKRHGKENDRQSRLELTASSKLGIHQACSLCLPFPHQLSLKSAHGREDMVMHTEVSSCDGVLQGYFVFIYTINLHTGLQNTCQHR